MTWLLLAIVVICGTVVSVAIGGGRQVATEGDSYLVTPAKLRSGLGKIGVSIRYVHPGNEPVPSVSGVASEGKVAVGFEYQLFPSSDLATAQDVGRLRATAFGWPARYRGFLYKHWVRGVLGNVAYAEYQKGVVESRSTVQEGHEVQLALQKIRRGLDDALFASFPSSDPYAHALSTTPE